VGCVIDQIKPDNWRTKRQKPQQDSLCIYQIKHQLHYLFFFFGNSAGGLLDM
jgi:hypothetical protein